MRQRSPEPDPSDGPCWLERRSCRETPAGLDPDRVGLQTRPRARFSHPPGPAQPRVLPFLAREGVASQDP